MGRVATSDRAVTVGAVRGFAVFFKEAPALETDCTTGRDRGLGDTVGMEGREGATGSDSDGGSAGAVGGSAGAVGGSSGSKTRG